MTFTIGFFEIYDGRTKAVVDAYRRFMDGDIQVAIGRWFEIVDGHPKVAAIVKEFQASGLPLLDLVSSHGNAELEDIAAGGRSSLGSALNAYRAVARTRLSASRVYFASMPPEFTGVDGEVTAVGLNRSFAELAKALAIEIRLRLDDRTLVLGSSDALPASDRTVSIDHNQPGYAELLERLSKVEDALHFANDYPDLEGKNQRLMEISAGKELLRGPKVRVDVLMDLLGGALRHLAINFERAALGLLAKAALDALKAFFGL